jgi:hypothetical protein
MNRICIFLLCLIGCLPAANAGVCVVGSQATANGSYVQPDVSGAYNIMAFFISGDCTGMYFLPSMVDFSGVLTRVSALETGAAQQSSAQSSLGVQVASLQSRIAALEGASPPSAGGSAVPFDPAVGAQIFALMVGSPLALFLLSMSAGSVIGIVRKR